MMSGYNLQEEALARDQARIELKRRVAEERRQRILNARTRLIGLDVGALDAQVAEMKAKKEQEKDQAKNEYLRQQEIQNLLEQAYEEERLLKKMHNDDVKQTWEYQRAALGAARSKKPDPDIDQENIGLSAAVTFAGEDNLRTERVRRQKDQMKSWVQQQVSEKNSTRAALRAEDEDYANMVRAVEGIREASYKEEQEMRRMIQRSVDDENKMLLALHKEKTRKVVGDANTPTSLDLFNEDQSAAWDENGRIIRRDMFKGFTPAQRRLILQENDLSIQQKRDRDEEDRQLERDWAKQQLAVQRYMEQANVEEQAIRDHQKSMLMDTLRQQAHDQATRKLEMKKDRYGKVEPRFFENFGTSAR